MLHAIPALPVRDLERSVAFYRDQLGFALLHGEAGFAVLRRDAVELHLWTAGDEAWRQRHATAPVLSGAESFLAGTASCRIAVTDVDALHAALRPLGVLHPNAPLRDEWYGAREFGVLDPDRNLITFYQPTQDPAA
jgi:catechol 2,3-dioxygenase-like lactoylglutathione lyase family enzyme